MRREIKSRHFSVRLTDAEAEQLHALADARVRTAVSYLRWLVVTHLAAVAKKEAA
jgi:hypothetical protein